MKKILLLCLSGLMSFSTFSQETIPLNDLSAFKNPHPDWRIVGDASADISQPNLLTTTEGKGVLACIHQQGKYGMEYELFSKLEHGDLDIEFDFMMAKGSNSGIYLQSRYEIQLYDSWGKKSVKYNDLGGIYERWNEAMPEGQKGYEGYAPRVNVAKAPGLWQHIKISFQAPRFDAAGKKIANAKILSINLNGITIHEDVELSGVTRGAISEQEVATGPLRFQGDHGSLAIRNIQVNNFNKPAATLSNLEYKVYYGSYPETTDLTTLTAKDSGKSEVLTWEVSKESNDYIIYFKGKLNAPTTGKYTFTLGMAGNSTLLIDGKQLLPNNWTVGSETRSVNIDLTAGEHTLELSNNKRDGWLKPTIGLWVAGPGFRATPLHVLSSTLANKPTDPILIKADANTHLRSFMDFKKSPEAPSVRVVHAISVGSPSNLHYTYDLDKGAIVQVWRGEFLDATPMWHDRGDGSSRPLGSVTPLTTDLLLGKSGGTWSADTAGTGYRPRGYILDENDQPTFRYEIFGSSVSDAIRVKDGKLFDRTITIQHPAQNLMARIADGKNIVKVADGLYAINDKSYYIQLPPSAGATIQNNADGQQELVVSAASGTVSYSLIF